jgi:aldose 1-epimerase
LEVEIDIEHGSRISSLRWNGLEFVVQQRPSLMDWGMYAMVPWAGRIRDGLIKNSSGEIFRLPTNWEPPHAEHGLGFYSNWEVINENTTKLKFPDPYAPAYAEQRFVVVGNCLRWNLEYYPNGCTLPAWVGFHPWFPRTLARGGSAEVMIDAKQMLVRGSDMLPTGDYSIPKPPPWDDAFTGVKDAPSIHWFGAAKVTISSLAPWWVVYTEDSQGVCIEPQSAPPDAANLKILGSHSLSVSFSFTLD